MPQAPRLVWLDEADARDPALVGAKACRLAQARARGLPVLKGFVVPVGVSDPVIRTGESVLRSTNNSGAARSAVFNRQPPPLLKELAEAGREIGDSLVVRSSSRAEADGAWAGAFSSYLGLTPEELAPGVIGCWASVFNPPTLKRGEAMGMSPREVGMAVLVQPEIRPTCGGVATLAAGGTVTVAAVRGHPAGLVAGWEKGQVATIAGGGEVHTDSSLLGSRLLREVADLSRATAEKIGCDHIEWMTDQKGKTHLVQAQLKVDSRMEVIKTQAPAPIRDRRPGMSGVVRMMIRYPGPVGEKLVWPWAIGLEPLSPAPTGQTRKSLATLIDDVHRGAALLMSQRWGEADSLADVEQAWSVLRNGDSSRLPDLLRGHPSVDRRIAAAHLSNLGDLGRALTTAGVIPHPGWIWYLDPDNLDRPPPEEPSPMRRIPLTSWDAWIYGVITSRGESTAGIPASGGWGAGRLRLIRNADDAASFCPREVIATSHPVGNIAPLLWNAAGLITVEGSPGAHLFEVAEWLAVPAVCGVDFRHWPSLDSGTSPKGADSIVAVDGDRGHLTWLPSKP